MHSHLGAERELTATRFLPRTDGQVLAYHHQEGCSPGVLFCPGFNSNMQGAKALALAAWCAGQGRQFTRFDYFGHGESSGSIVDGTIGRWREDTLAILGEVCSGPQVIVGSSMGAWMMLLAAIAHPQRIGGLLGLAAAPDFTHRLRREVLSSEQLALLASQAYCDLPSDYDDGRPYRISRRLLEEGEQHLLLQDGRLEVDVPVRLIHGQCDEDIPWQHSLTLAASLSSRDVDVHLVKAGDHRLSSEGDLRRMLSVLGELCDG